MSASLADLKFGNPIGRHTAARLNKAIDSCGMAAMAKSDAARRAAQATIGASPNDIRDAKIKARRADEYNAKCVSIMLLAVRASGFASATNILIPTTDVVTSMVAGQTLAGAGAPDSADVAACSRGGANNPRTLEACDRVFSKIPEGPR